MAIKLTNSMYVKNVLIKLYTLYIHHIYVCQNELIIVQKRFIHLILRTRLLHRLKSLAASVFLIGKEKRKF